MAKKFIYLDHAAATPLDPKVLKTMLPYMSRQFFNPSALYQPAREVLADLNIARAKIAHWLGAKPSEIIFTAGGTEANNLAIHGVMQQYPKASIVISAVEHESVIEPANQYKVKTAPVKTDGTVDLAALEKLIDDQTVLVSVMQANNEVGTIQPIHKIAKLIQKIRRNRSKNSLPLYLHTDAAQAANYLDLHVHRLGVDLMIINGGKIYGPKQSGVLFIKTGVELKPQILGGGQEQSLRSGTESVVNAIGLAKALDLVQTKKDKEVKRLQTLQKLFLERLQKTIPTLRINGSLKNRLPNNVHITLSGQNNERLLIELDQAGIYAAAGSACTASSDDPSHVLLAMGKTKSEVRSSLRFTLGQTTTAADIKQTVKTLAQIIAKSRN